MKIFNKNFIFVIFLETKEDWRDEAGKDEKEISC